MSNYNAAKIEILGIIEDLGETTTMEIAELTGKRYENVSVLCLQYHRFGLLHRRSLKGRAYAYSISTRGLERLEWLRRED